MTAPELSVLRATRERRTTAAELRTQLDVRPELPGPAALAELLGFMVGGCDSELEIVGVRHVLAVPGIPPCEEQYRLLLPHGPVRLDVAFHGSPDAHA